MSEIERALRSASTAHGLSATGSLLREAADELSRLRSENQIRAQEYAALLGLWKDASGRLEKAERVVAAARPYAIKTQRLHSAFAQYDSHAEQKETT